MILDVVVRNFTSPNGKPVIFHFQDSKQAIQAMENRDLVQLALTASKNKDFAEIANGSTASIHVVVGKKGYQKFLSKEDFDTFRTGEWPEIKEFRGPNIEESLRYMGHVPGARKFHAQAAKNGECKHCLVPNDLCPIRMGDFDPVSFEKEIAKFSA